MNMFLEAALTKSVRPIYIYGFGLAWFISGGDRPAMLFVSLLALPTLGFVIDLAFGKCSQ